MSNPTANLNPCAEASREDLDQAAMSLSIDLAETRRQRDDLLAALRGLMAIANNSNGVSGYHLNGSIAEWEDFEEIEIAERAIEKAEQ